MTGRLRRFVLTYLVAAPLAVLLLGVATLGWATSRDAEPYGLRFGSPADALPDGTASRVTPDDGAPDDGTSDGGTPSDDGAGTADGPDGPADDGAPAGAGSAGAPDLRPVAGAPYPGIADLGPTRVGDGAAATPRPGVRLPGVGGLRLPGSGPDRSGVSSAADCRTGADLVPTCGVLWGVDPASTGRRGLRDFEERTGRHQDIYRADHRGTGSLFPTGDEIDIARESGRRRALLLTWTPTGTSWAKIAQGDRTVDRYLDRLAAHLREKYRDDFFFAVHPAAEDDVRAARGSGHTAADYAAMYRHVVRRLRAHGVDNLVTVLVYAADPAHTDRRTFDAMYPGDDVVDWIGFDAGVHGDAVLDGLLDRRADGYAWASAGHPGKPLMISEWGVRPSRRHPDRVIRAYAEVGRQIGRLPRIKALVHVDAGPGDSTTATRRAYRELGALPIFQVDLKR